MLLLKYLNSFILYNILLIIFFSITVTAIDELQIINSISYVCFHFTIIYLGLYYYHKILYLIYFLYGLGFDLLLINQIGTHLSIFILLLLFFTITKKYINNFNSKKIYFLILFILIITIFLEMLVTNVFFSYNFYYFNYLKMILISIIISYPVFIIFNKIDNL